MNYEKKDLWSRKLQLVKYLVYARGRPIAGRGKTLVNLVLTVNSIVSRRACAAVRFLGVYAGSSIYARVRNTRVHRLK